MDSVIDSLVSSSDDVVETVVVSISGFIVVIKVISSVDSIF